MDWIEYDAGYLAGDGQIMADGSAGNYRPYIPDNVIIFRVTGGQNSLFLLHGPSMDLASPPNWTGVFTKSWEEDDPSVRQVLMEEQWMAYMTNPFKTGTLTIG